MLRIVGYCETIDDLNSLLYVPYEPVALGSPEPVAAAINGAVIFTTGLMATTFVAFLLTGYLGNQTGASAINRGMARVVTSIMAYYGPNIVEIATSSIGHFSSSEKALAITAMAVWNAAFFWAAYQVYRKVSKDEVSKLSLLPFYEPTRDFESKPIRLLVLADMAVAYVLAMLSGMKPNAQSCGIIATSMLMVSIGYLGYVVGFRPYRSKLDQGFVMVNALLQITLSGLIRRWWRKLNLRWQH